MGVRLRAMRAAFPLTVPVMAGYLSLGTAYGVFMTASGFPWWYPLLTSVAIYGGSLEFLSVNLLLGAFSPLQALVMAVMLQARHLFYGLAMLERYRGIGWKKFPLIYGLTDETFSVNCAAEIPAGIDRGWFYFFVTALDHSYWITGATVGGILGGMLAGGAIDTRGLDFVMTAMFAVIFLEQWLKEDNHLPSLFGLGVTGCCLLFLGPDRFLLPALLGILLLLTAFRGILAKEEQEQ